MFQVEQIIIISHMSVLILAEEDSTDSEICLHRKLELCMYFLSRSISVSKYYMVFLRLGTSRLSKTRDKMASNVLCCFIYIYFFGGGGEEHGVGSYCILQETSNLICF